MIIVWLNKNNNSYYYKVSKGTYANYHVGFTNQYNHEVVLIIKLDYFLEKRKEKVSFRKMLINDTIRFLEKIR